ncbi:hypothetical protein DFH27DRAFT_563097 [Peziza echinospora]|nr:hypothetical protein DFH27DRAFT_563097 [Peziza echinospora]
MKMKMKMREREREVPFMSTYFIIYTTILLYYTFSYISLFFGDCACAWVSLFGGWGLGFCLYTYYIYIWIWTNLIDIYTNT